MARAADMSAPGNDRAARLLNAAGWLALRSAGIVALLAAWELTARSGAVTTYVLPPLSLVLERIWNDAVAGELWLNTGLTLYRALVGFAIAALGGIVLGVAMSRNVAVNWLFDPIISVGF